MNRTMCILVMAYLQSCVPSGYGGRATNSVDSGKVATPIDVARDWMHLRLGMTLDTAIGVVMNTNRLASQRCELELNPNNAEVVNVGKHHFGYEWTWWTERCDIGLSQPVPLVLGGKRVGVNVSNAVLDFRPGGLYEILLEMQPPMTYEEVVKAVADAFGSPRWANDYSQNDSEAKCQNDSEAKCGRGLYHGLPYGVGGRATVWMGTDTAIVVSDAAPCSPPIAIKIYNVSQTSDWATE